MNDTLETRNKPKQTPFRGWNKINRATKSFDSNTTIKRKGKQINLQQYLNENNQDCTIYDVYKTYRGDLELTKKQLNVLTHKVADELQEINNLASAFDVMKAAEKSWNDMPLKIREEFGHNVKSFQKFGLKWANEHIAKANAEIKRKQDLITQAKKEMQEQMQTTTNNTQGA